MSVPSLRTDILVRPIPADRQECPSYGGKLFPAARLSSPRQTHVAIPIRTEYCPYNNGTWQGKKQLDEIFVVGTLKGMATNKKRRGRPPKGQDRVKADYLDIRLGSSEKTTFKDAAELAGLDLSAWVRERLRSASRKELEAAGLPVAFLAKRTEGRNGQILQGPPDRLISARYEKPWKVRLDFADGRSGVWSFRQLGLYVANMKLTSITASASGTSMEVKSKSNDDDQAE